MYLYVKKSQLSESDVKLTVKSTAMSIFRVKVSHYLFISIVNNIKKRVYLMKNH